MRPPFPMSPETRAHFLADMLAAQTRLLAMQAGGELRIPEMPIKAWLLLVTFMMSQEGETEARLSGFAILLWAIVREPGMACAVGWPHDIADLRAWMRERECVSTLREAILAVIPTLNRDTQGESDCGVTLVPMHQGGSLLNEKKELKH